MTPALTLLHKPVGASSFSFVQAAINAARKARPDRRPRICHGGALDPFASGLLILLSGSATRLFEHLHPIPKTYLATIRWSIETDNDDPLGKPIFTGDATNLTPTQLDEALAAAVGWQDQIPPSMSNKRIGGERAYLKAHRGETVELPPSRVYLHEARWMWHDLPRQSVVKLVARGGYYVRALARDLGRKLGCGAHLEALERNSIGPYADPGPGKQVDVRGRELLPWLPARMLSEGEIGELKQDRPIPGESIFPPDSPLPADFPGPSDPIRGFYQDRLVFLLRSEGQMLLPMAVFPGGI